MKKLYTLMLVFGICFTVSAATETLIRHNLHTGPMNYVNPPYSSYLGNGQILTATLGYDYTNFNNYADQGVRLMLCTTNGATLMSSYVAIDTPVYNAILYDAGKTTDGGYYVYYTSNVTDSFGSNTLMTLVKLSSTGNLVWNSRVNMPDFFYTTGSPIKVRQNSLGDFYVNGNADHTMTICKISAGGNFGWGKTITFDPNQKNPIPDVNLVGDTEVVLCANPSQNSSAYVALDANGVVKWAANYSSTTTTTTPTVIIPTSDGNLAAGNTIYGYAILVWKLNYHGDVLWRKSYNCAGGQFKMTEMSDGTLMCVAWGNGPVTMMRLSATGDVLEKKIVMGGSTVNVNEITKEGSDFVLVSTTTMPLDTVPYTLVLKGHNLSDLCETLNTPITATNDAGTYLLVGTASNLIIHSLNSDVSANLTADNTVGYSVTTSDYCGYMLPVNQVTADAQIAVFPVPANDEVTIQLPQLPTGLTTLKLFDINGQLVMQQTLETQQTVLPINSLAKGIYMAEIKTPEASVMRRLIKM